MRNFIANCVGFLAILATNGICQAQQFACGGQFPGPGGCLVQHLRISDVIYAPYDNVAFGGVNGYARRAKGNDARIVWDFGAPDNNGYFQIKSRFGGLFLSANNGALEPRMWDVGLCNQAPNQCKWKFLSYPSAFTRIQALAGGRCLTVPSVSEVAMPLQLQTCATDSSDTRQFFLLYYAPYQ